MISTNDRVVADTAVLLLVTALFFLAVFWNGLKRQFFFFIRARRIPGPPTNPLFGNLGDIRRAGGLAYFCELLDSLHSKHGPVVRLWLGFRNLVVSVRDPDLAKCVLINAVDRQSPDNPKPTIERMMFASDDEACVQRPFLDYHCHVTLMYQVHSSSLLLAKLRVRHWFQLAANGGCIDIKKESRHIISGILGHAIFGPVFFDSSPSSEMEHLITCVGAGQQRFWQTFWPSYRWTTEFKDHCSNLQRLQEVSRRLLSSALSGVHSRGLGHSDLTAADIAERAMALQRPESFVQAMMRERTRDGDRLFTFETAASTAVSLMIHGSMASGTILAHVLVYLALHPDFQAKAHQEIDSVCGKRPPMFEEQLDTMHYLTAVIYEAARLSPIHPVLRRCSLQTDLRLGEHLVPAGATICLPTQSFQKDKSVWGADADKFNPHRFLRLVSRYGPEGDPSEETGGTDSLRVRRKHKEGWMGTAITQTSSTGATLTAVGPPVMEPISHHQCSSSNDGSSSNDSSSEGRVPTKYAFVDPGAGPYFLLFGAGPRACIGQRFALHHLRAVLAGILQQCEITMAPGSPSEFTLGIEALMLTFQPDPMIVPRRRNIQ